MKNQPTNKRNSFVFYRSFFEAVSDLPDKEKLELYDAIAKFALDFEVPELSGVSKAIFTLIKPQIEANHQKYINGCKGGESGGGGGRPPKKITPQKPLNNPTETPQKPLNNPTETPNVNVNVNVNENVNENDCIAEPANFLKKESPLTQEAFEALWYESFTEDPKGGFEEKYQTFVSNWSKLKDKQAYQGCWKVYFFNKWKHFEYNLDPNQSPHRIAERNQLEAKARQEAKSKERQEFENYFAKHKYDTQKTENFKSKAIDTLGKSASEIFTNEVVAITTEDGKTIFCGTETAVFNIILHHKVKLSKTLKQWKIGLHTFFLPLKEYVDFTKGNGSLEGLEKYGVQ